jgi:hypothetical protein
VNHAVTQERRESQVLMLAVTHLSQQGRGALLASAVAAHHDCIVLEELIGQF